MNTILLQTAGSDVFARVPEPQPIAAVMSAVLARYDLLKAAPSNHGRAYAYQSSNSPQATTSLAVA